MATGKTPKGSDFARRDGEGTDPTASASDEILPGPGDSTNPTGVAVPAFKLVALHGPRAGSEFPLDADEITLGRGTDNGISVPDVSVSRHHVRFVRDGESFSVVDLKSGNGTKVNGAQQEKALLEHGDEIILGDTVLQFVNVGLPPPPRYRAAAAPSGKVASPVAATEARAAPVEKAAAPPPPPTPAAAPVIVPATAAVTDTAPSSSPVPPPPPPPAPPKAKKQGGGGGIIRFALYSILFVLLAIIVAVVIKRGTNRLSAGGGAQGSEVILSSARQLALDRKWTEALAELVHKGSAAPDPTITKWTEGARVEATAQTAYEKASNSLVRGDYKTALDLAKAINPDADYGEDAQEKIIRRMPEILASALVDARTALHGGDHERCSDIVDRVLLASPTNADALDLRTECVYKAPPPPPPPRDAGPAPVVDAGPTVPTYQCYGPAVTMYLQDKLPKAIEIAGTTVIPTCQDLQQKLNEFQNHRMKGNELAQNKHIPEAAKEFEAANRIDEYIAKDRLSAAGKQVRDPWSRMEYLLALDAKGDEQLPNRAKHLKLALKANSENDLAKKELDKVYDHCRNDLFSEAYQEKAQDKEQATRLFRIVAQTLSDGDEKRTKALYWVDQLTKKP